MTGSLKPTAANGSRKRVPDFFIVGHPKCGTTALYETLKRHPQIYMPDIKEPNFFVTEIRHHAPWRKYDWSAETLDDYLSLFDTARLEQRIGEASVHYLWSRAAASGIAAVQPHARIIAILREPASFLRSLHLQFVQSNAETEKDLQKALSLEDARRQRLHVLHSLSKWQELLLYSDQVRYVDQLRRYHALFPPEHVMVIIYDDFLSDNDAIVRTVLRFLDVDDTATFLSTKANPTVRVRSVHLNNMVKAVYTGHGSVSRSVKTGIKVLMPSRRLRRHALRMTRHHILYSEPPVPDEALMMELRHRFKPEVVALSEYLGRDLVTLWGYDRVG